MTGFLSTSRASFTMVAQEPRRQVLLQAGRLLVVPFFGDQPFWGAMVARAGAGPDPIPIKQLTADKLADAIELLPQTCNPRTCQSTRK